MRNGQVKFAAKTIQANYIACELSVQRVVTFDVVLYRNQWPVNFFFKLLNCRVVLLSMTKRLCLEIMLSNVIKSK